MITLAHHADGVCTGRVAYLDGVTRADLPDLLPLLGCPVPIDAERGIITDSVFAYQCRLSGSEVPLGELFAEPRVEVAPGIWRPASQAKHVDLDPRDYRD